MPAGSVSIRSPNRDSPTAAPANHLLCPLPKANQMAEKRYAVVDLDALEDASVETENGRCMEAHDLLSAVLINATEVESSVVWRHITVWTEVGLPTLWADGQAPTESEPT
jgi:hypothetical protein